MPLIAFVTSWSLNWPILVGLALYAGLYAVGRARLHARGQTVHIPTWRAWCYGCGLATIGLALLSPLAAYSGLLFFMHMIEHMLILVVAPLLLLLGAPLLPVLWVFPRNVRRELALLFAPRSPLHRIFHVLTTPAVALIVYLLVVAVWHLPVMYDAAQGPAIIHDLEHLIFLGAGLLYWWPVVHPTGGRRRLGFELAPLYLLAAAAEGGVIGGVFVEINRPLYETYLQAHRIWGISPLLDQELGGLIMMTGDVIYITAAFVTFIKYINQDERTVRAKEAAAFEEGQP